MRSMHRSSYSSLSTLGALLVTASFVIACDSSKSGAASVESVKAVSPTRTDSGQHMSVVDVGPVSPEKKVVVTRPACPPGTTLEGGVPPKGTELWCELRGKRHGAYTRWHESGQIAEQATFRAGQYEGPSLQWDPEGRILEEGTYRSGQRDGLWKTYRNGLLNFEGEFKNGVQDGRFLNYAGNGEKQGEGQFRDGKPCGVFKCYKWETGQATKCIPLEEAPGCTLSDTGATCGPCEVKTTSK
jgi:hypothetical protein